MFKFFQHHRAQHISLLYLAFPMILSNITVPLLGLVDTAVIGHLGQAHFLAGVALGSGSIALLFWLASFLRMSTTGIIAQAYGARQWERLSSAILASAIIALSMAFLLILIHPLLLDGIAALSDASAPVMEQARSYFQIRIFSAPAALLNLVFLGVMLGVQYGKGPFYLVLMTNIVNIVLDVIFVVGLDWGVSGAAWASVIADYSALLLALILLKKNLPKDAKQHLSFPTKAKFLDILSLNKDIFIRSLCLQLCFSFMTFYGARLGENTLAANAVLLNFLMLVSFAMDGLAYAVESKVGHAKGEQAPEKVHLWVKVSLYWGGIFAMLYSMLFATLGLKFITILTPIDVVVETASHYLPWLILLPLIAMFCFLFDGIFVGLTRAKDMRNSMIFSVSIGFFLPFFLTMSWGNHALWFAMNVFMFTRGMTLIVKYRTLRQAGLI